MDRVKSAIEQTLTDMSSTTKFIKSDDKSAAEQTITDQPNTTMYFKNIGKSAPEPTIAEQSSTMSRPSPTSPTP